jgi:hypothetical protein
VGTKLNFNLGSDVIQDPDHDALKYTAKLVNADKSLSYLPSWLNFDDKNIAFYGTPLNTGAHNVSINADDSLGGTVTLNVIIDVYNNPPNLVNRYSPNKDFTAHVGTAYEWTIPDGNVADVDGDLIAYSMFLLPNSSPLPDWLKFD